MTFNSRQNGITGERGRALLHLDQTCAGRELRFDVRPNALDRGEQDGCSAVAESKPDHGDWLRPNQSHPGKVFIFGHDYTAIAGCLLPDKFIERLCQLQRKHVSRFVSFAFNPTRQRGGQLIVDEESPHDARKTT